MSSSASASASSASKRLLERGLSKLKAGRAKKNLGAFFKAGERGGGSKTSKCEARSFMDGSLALSLARTRQPLARLSWRGACFG